MHETINLFWFRRDLRLHDNHGLYEALISGRKVLPVFIFDPDILNGLPADDLRVNFIWKSLKALNDKLGAHASAISVFYGRPREVFALLASRYPISTVFTNRDYEPSAIRRDAEVELMLSASGISFRSFKDQVMFEHLEIVKPDGKPYVVFTPYGRRWLEKLNSEPLIQYNTAPHFHRFLNYDAPEMPAVEDFGFIKRRFDFPETTLSEEKITAYAETRNIPGLDSTTRIGLHLRFGTVSVRDCVIAGRKYSAAWLNELIWREFFMQILANFPHVESHAFKPEYDRIQWQQREDFFDRWREGKTGYPLVDAGMRELSETGFMHNRVRMVTASFLTKHLLTDWRLGEAWFAEKLLDFELSSNNGNWQWAAGSGCDAAPYFRIFNPSEQARKFDPQAVYIRKWVPGYGTTAYPRPIVDHTAARQRCLAAYSAALRP